MHANYYARFALAAIVLVLVVQQDRIVSLFQDNSFSWTLQSFSSETTLSSPSSPSSSPSPSSPSSSSSPSSPSSSSSPSSPPSPTPFPTFTLEVDPGSVASDALPIRGKMAICVAGPPRGLFKSKVIESMKKFMTQFPGDVFAVMPINPSELERYDAIIKSWNPVYTNFTTGSVYKPFRCTGENEHPRDVNDDKFQVEYSKVKVCYDAIRAKEVEVGFRYSHIVKTRPDFWYTEARLDVNVAKDCMDAICVPDNHFIGSIADHIAIIPRHMGDVYMLVGDRLTGCMLGETFKPFCHIFYDATGYVPPECFLSYFTKKYGAKYHKFHKLHLHLERSSGPERFIDFGRRLRSSTDKLE